MSVLAADEANRASWITGAVVIPVTTGGVRTAALSPGTYVLVADADCYWLQGGSGVTAAIISSTSSSNYLPAKVPMGFVKVIGAQSGANESDNYISAITTTGTANLHIMRVT